MVNRQVVDFDINKKNLLQDVITKQTGDFNKAIKELFQNSFDAGATKITAILDQDSLRFIDNGCGMNREEVYKFFRVFGATQKRHDDKKIGAFGMGRGQVFNFGFITWKTQNYIMSVDIRKSLDYVIEGNDEYVDGTDITIKFYKPLYSWDISNIIYRIKRNILPPEGIFIELNGEVYNPDITKYKDFSNNKYLVFTSKWHQSKIFNRGLSVKPIKYSNYKYSVMPYEKLKLNFARNELLETEQSTTDLNYFINDIEQLMASKKNRFNLDEALNVLRLLSTKRISLKSVYDKKIIPLASEKLVSFREIIEDKNLGVLFGSKNVWSDDCLRQGYQVISTSVYTEMRRIRQNFKLKELEFLDKDVKDLSRKGFYKEIELNGLKKNVHYYYMAIELNEYVFSRVFNENEDYLRSIKLGISDLASAWTDGYFEIFINRMKIEGFSTKEEALLGLWETLCHEYAHTRKNTKEDHHNYEFYENYQNIVVKSLTFLPQCMRYITRKFLKEKYGF